MTIAVENIKEGTVLLMQAETDIVYEFVKGKTKYGFSVVNGRFIKEPIQIAMSTKSIRRGKPISMVVKSDKKTLITPNIISMKMILPNGESIEIWEEGINENFGPG